MIYYHGTHPESIYAIATGGFKIGEERSGRVLGNGLYIANELKTVMCYGFLHVFKCELSESTRILWIDREVDRSVLSYLRKEYGKELFEVGPRIDKVIPRNKQLTKKELIAFVTWFFNARPFGFRRGQLYWKSLSVLLRHVRRHGYHAIGEHQGTAWDNDQIMVFEPHRVKPLTCHCIEYKNHSWADFENPVGKLGPALSLDDMKKISDKELQWIKQWEEENQ